LSKIYHEERKKYHGKIIFSGWEKSSFQAVLVKKGDAPSSLQASFFFILRKTLFTISASIYCQVVDLLLAISSLRNARLVSAQF